MRLAPAFRRWSLKTNLALSTRASRSRSPRRFRLRVSRPGCATTSTSRSPAADAEQLAPAPGRGRVPASHCARERGQPGARPLQGARARDWRSGCRLAWLTSSDASAPHRKRAAVGRRRSPGCPVRFRRDSLDFALMPEFYVLNESRVTIDIPVLLFSSVSP